MTRITRIAAGIVGCLFAAIALTACTDRDIESMENGLWYMFASHPKPVILKKPPPPVYCYPTLADAVCYETPQEPLSQ